MNGSRFFAKISQKFLCCCHVNKLLNSNAIKTDIKSSKLSSFTCQARSYSTHADISLARNPTEHAVIQSATCDVRGKLNLDYRFLLKFFFRTNYINETVLKYDFL